MSKKSNFSFSPAELHGLITALENSDSPVSANLLKRFYKKLADNLNAAAEDLKDEDDFGLTAADDVKLKKAIIKGLSIVSGKSEGTIQPGDDIESYHLSNTHIEKLRLYLNAQIEDFGGDGSISGSDMSSASTVQALINLVLSKIP